MTTPTETPAAESSTPDTSTSLAAADFANDERQRHAPSVVPGLRRPRCAAVTWARCPAVARPGRAVHRLLDPAAGHLHQQPQHRQPARAGVRHLRARDGPDPRAAARRDRPVRRRHRRYGGRLHGRRCSSGTTRPWPSPSSSAWSSGAIIGLVIGLLVAKLGIPSFVVTLAFFLGLQGVTLKLIGLGGTVPGARRGAARHHHQVDGGGHRLDRGDRSAGDLRRA